MKKIISSYP